MAFSGVGRLGSCCSGRVLEMSVVLVRLSVCIGVGDDFEMRPVL